MKKRLCKILRWLANFCDDQADVLDEELHDELRKAMKDTDSFVLIDPDTCISIHRQDVENVDIRVDNCAHGISWRDACDVCGRSAYRLQPYIE